MPNLSPSALERLASVGITERDWITYGDWFEPVVDENGHEQLVPGAEWRGDTCGCLDDRCMGYHHAAADECGCLDQLIARYHEIREVREAWLAYVETRATSTQRPDDYDAEGAHIDAREWLTSLVKLHHPRALTVSAEELVKGRAGISVTYPGADPGYTGSAPADEGTYRQMVYDAAQLDDAHPIIRG